MLYTNVQELLSFLKKHNLWMKKEMGQNFLVNRAALEKILSSADIHEDDHILEIGPGLGILTAELAKTKATIRTIEIDRDLMPVLQETFQNVPNVEIEWGNALKAKLPTVPYKVVANIPYYITSPLLNHFLQPQTAEEKRPTRMVLLIQKEVADKICAGENNHTQSSTKAINHTILSLQVQIFGKPKIAALVNKRSFFPQPKVDSAILVLEVYPKPLADTPATLLKLAKEIFGRKRKTILNSLQSQLRLPKEEALLVLQKAGIEPDRRPQTFSIQDWNHLLRELPQRTERAKKAP